MGEVFVHPRVHERHPDITDADVMVAWDNCIVCVTRLDVNPSDVLAIGSDGRGRVLEMIATRTGIDSWIVYHAFTPPTRRFLAEIDHLGRL